MKNVFIPIVFILLTSSSKAQLASEKDLASVYSSAAKQKLAQPKTMQSQKITLPGDAPLPKQVTQVKANSKATDNSHAEQNLPSNLSQTLPLIHRPKGKMKNNKL